MQNGSEIDRRLAEGMPPHIRNAGAVVPVVVRILVSDSGSVDSVRVHVTSGFVTLDNVARRAVRRARFAPRSASGAREWTDLLQASYPPALSDADAVVGVYVSATGEILDILLFGSGGLCGIDRTALEVARTMQFRPALSQGTPVAVRVEVPLTFDARRQ